MFEYSTPIVLDLLFIIPTWITINSLPVNYIPLGQMETSWEQVKWIFFGLKNIRILRLFRITPKVVETFENEVQQRMGGMGVFIVVMILFSK